jgi:hypothetical protein
MRHAPVVRRVARPDRAPGSERPRAHGIYSHTHIYIQASSTAPTDPERESLSPIDQRRLRYSRGSRRWPPAERRLECTSADHLRAFALNALAWRHVRHRHHIYGQARPSRDGPAALHCTRSWQARRHGLARRNIVCCSEASARPSDGTIYHSFLSASRRDPVPCPDARPPLENTHRLLRSRRRCARADSREELAREAQDSADRIRDVEASSGRPALARGR